MKIWKKEDKSTYDKICQYKFEAYSDVQSRANVCAWLFQSKYNWHLIFGDNSIIVGDYNLSDEAAQKIAERIMQDKLKEMLKSLTEE